MQFDFLYFKSPYNPNNGIFLLQPYVKRFGTVKRLLSKHPRIEVARKHLKFGLITNLFTIKRKKTVLEYKSIILSDIHLGMRDCKAKEATHFLKPTHSETLLLIGDIIDAWSQRRRIGKLKSLYSPGYQEIERIMTKVIYL